MLALSGAAADGISFLHPPPESPGNIRTTLGRVAAREFTRPAALDAGSRLDKQRHARYYLIPVINWKPSGGAMINAFTRKMLFALLVVASLSPPVFADQSTTAGQALAQRVYDRPDGDDATSSGTMVLVDPGHQPRVRQMYVYRRDLGDGAVDSLIRFTSPPDIENTGLLTADRVGDETDQWIYLPALDRSRRIASSRKGGQFVGSDLYYEDLRDRPVNIDSHRLLGQDEMQGVKCEVLESIPVDPDNSVYGKRISCIHLQTLVALRIDFYPKNGDEPIKRSEVHRVENVQGYWTVMDSTMTDLKSGHKTRMAVDKIVYDQHLPEDIFSRQALEDPARERPFRP